MKVGTHAAGPETISHVWLAPRNVDAADVTASNGESERYLFYRGVGNFDQPLAVTLDEDRISLSSRGPEPVSKFIVFESRNGYVGYAAVDSFNGAAGQAGSKCAGAGRDAVSRLPWTGPLAPSAAGRGR